MFREPAELPLYRLPWRNPLPPSRDFRPDASFVCVATR